MLRTYARICLELGIARACIDESDRLFSEEMHDLLFTRMYLNVRSSHMPVLFYI